MKKTIVLIISIFTISFANAQLIVTTATGTTLQQQLIQNMLGGVGTVVSNITYNGSGGAIVWNNIGTFTTGSSPTNLGLTSGLILGTGGVTGSIGPNNSTSTTVNIVPSTPDMSDSDLVALVPGSGLHDAAVLEFDFKLITDTLKVRYIFGSEEYAEYVNSSYNDVFGFFVSGANPSGGTYNKHNIALVPDTTLPISINTINNGYNNAGPCKNCAYYVDNTGGTTIQADGFTTLLTAWCLVVPCQTYHFKIAIADRYDKSLDSWVWLDTSPSSTGSGNLTGASMVCKEESVVYSIPNSSSFTQYIWSLPNGATGSSDSNSIVVNFGNNAQSGIITLSGLSTCGIDTLTSILVTVNPKPPTPTITQTANTLHSSAISGNQWYNAASGIIIGDTTQTLSPTTNGDYFVIVTANGCSSDSSNHFHYVNAGIEENENNNGIKVYPNPVSNELVIEMVGNKEKVSFEIYNSIGQSIYKGNLIEKTIVQTTNFAQGVYIIKLENGKVFEFKKIVKE